MSKFPETHALFQFSIEPGLSRAHTINRYNRWIETITSTKHHLDKSKSRTFQKRIMRNPATTQIQRSSNFTHIIRSHPDSILSTTRTYLRSNFLPVDHINFGNIARGPRRTELPFPRFPGSEPGSAIHMKLLGARHRDIIHCAPNKTMHYSTDNNSFLYLYIYSYRHVRAENSIGFFLDWIISRKFVRGFVHCMRKLKCHQSVSGTVFRIVEMHRFSSTAALWIY